MEGLGEVETTAAITTPMGDSRMGLNTHYKVGRTHLLYNPLMAVP